MEKAKYYINYLVNNYPAGSRYYWLVVLINIGDISQADAGYICQYIF